MIERILDLFRSSSTLVEVAPALRALGVEDVTDLAIVEFCALASGNPRRLVEWVESWPYVPGLGKAALNLDATQRRLGLERLVSRGALEKTAVERFRPSEALLRLLPGYPRRDEARALAAGHLDLGRALEEIGAAAGITAEVSSRLADAISTIATRLAPLAAHDRAALDADVAGTSVRAQRIALALTLPAADDATSALAGAIAAAVEGTVATLAPLAHESAGPRVLDALRLLVLRFGESIALDFDPSWLVGSGVTKNIPRREELLRRFARWASLDVAREGKPEDPLAQLAGLLGCDHRREALFDEELAHRARIEALAQQRIEAEKKKRDDAAASYSSGRRE